jgi:hypothetical protein
VELNRVGYALQEMRPGVWAVVADGWYMSGFPSCEAAGTWFLDYMDRLRDHAALAEERAKRAAAELEILRAESAARLLEPKEVQ